MKVTKEYLKRLIKEQLEADGMEVGEFNKSQYNMSKEPLTGIDKYERKIINDLEEMIRKAARTGNLSLSTEFKEEMKQMIDRLEDLQ